MTEIVPKNIDRIYNFQYTGRTIDTLVIGNNIKQIDDFAFFGANIGTIYYYAQTELSETCKSMLSSQIIYTTEESRIEDVSTTNTNKPASDWGFPEVETSQIDFSHITLNEGQSIDTNSNAISNTAKIIVEDTNVADIDDKGNIVSKNPGTTIVTIKDESGTSQQMTITVPEPTPEITLDEFPQTELSPDLFTYVILPNDNVAITGLKDENLQIPYLVFPSRIEGRPVTQIRFGYCAFKMFINSFGHFWNCGVRYVKFPDTVEFITVHLLSNCEQLERVDLPKTSPKYYYELYNWDFDESTSDDYPTRLVFSQCPNLRKVVIPDGWERIPEEYFWNCYNLEEVVIPDSVKKIGRAAFGGTNLKELKLPEGLEEYEPGIYSYNRTSQIVHDITELTIPEKVTKIKPNTFAYCVLNKLTFKGRVEVGEGAFKDGKFIELILEKGATGLSNATFRYSSCGTLYVPANEIDNYRHLTCFNRILPIGLNGPTQPRIPCEKLNLYESIKATWNIPGYSSKYERYVLQKGQSMNLTYTKFPFDTTDKVTFESDKPDFVKVTSDGKVTGLEYLFFDRSHKEDSTAKITVKCGDLKKEIRVCVEL